MRWSNRAEPRVRPSLWRVAASDFSIEVASAACRNMTRGWANRSLSGCALRVRHVGPEGEGLPLPASCSVSPDPFCGRTRNARE